MALRSIAHKNQNQSKEEQIQRKVDKWWLGKMLGKGGYSWVKLGRHVTTGKAFALKFMSKADKENRWAREQAKQVATEIESLKKITHKNIMKLYAYNLNCQYPKTDGTYLKTIMLVLEMAPGGELFDLLYYTKHFDEVTARTYFKQLMGAVKAMHTAGVIHRDLKPQNLLLNSSYQLKVTDFGLSKLFDKNEKAVFKTTYVGTKGYQAPELLLNRAYTLKADIFSCGVILFILLTGYPPFEQAIATDTWFRCLAAGKYERFWKKHSNPITDALSAGAKDLIQKCLCYQPAARATVDQILEHPWLNADQTFHDEKNLADVVQKRHKVAMEKKKNDTKKQEILQTSMVNNVNRALFDFAKHSVPQYDKLTFPVGTMKLEPEVHPGTALQRVRALILSNLTGCAPIVDVDKMRLVAELDQVDEETGVCTKYGLVVSGYEYLNLKKEKEYCLIVTRCSVVQIESNVLIPAVELEKDVEVEQGARPSVWSNLMESLWAHCADLFSIDFPRLYVEPEKEMGEEELAEMQMTLAEMGLEELEGEENVEKNVKEVEKEVEKNVE